ncbi:MAG: DNA repair protein RadC [Pseudomonadota bacterium]|jgi:DNA repair protein RadC|uniref:RadC family protein n=1 Tax=Brevundimonas TaxID=41275 RepID=UPI001A2BEB30|nr:DNA repair protein RadC [Brevundimonas sp.]MBJ7484134.1 DNA repair protein RadC [Brevundimonas sp.]MDA0699859.1 DNA repair protein RadC [bacterium]MEC8456099.1 DNA repair protein RadC [Pseudomonadota bacterium]
MSPEARKVQDTSSVIVGVFGDRSFASLDDRALLKRLLGPAAHEIDLDTPIRRLFDRYGGLAAIIAADLSELARVSDLPKRALEHLKLSRLLSERLARSEASARPVISSWTALLAYARVALAEAPREQFRVLFLDSRNQLLTDELVADGTIDHAPVYPREVVRRALEASAAALILVHNHPSGDPTPSRADIEVTRQIVDASKLFGIKVHDHLVVGRGHTASFRTLGLLS